jgi:hypothetical protein
MARVTTVSGLWWVDLYQTIMGGLVMFYSSLCLAAMTRVNTSLRLADMNRAYV